MNHAWKRLLQVAVIQGRKMGIAWVSRVEGHNRSSDNRDFQKLRPMSEQTATSHSLATNQSVTGTSQPPLECGH